MFDYKYCNILMASNIAKQSESNTRHGCVIMSKNKIIAEGCNAAQANRGRLLVKYGPRKMGCTVHAETAAIEQLLANLRYGTSNTNIKRKKYDLYVARDNLKNSKSCRNCIELLKHFGIYRAIYSDDNTETGYTTEKVSTLDNNIYLSIGDIRLRKHEYKTTKIVLIEDKKLKLREC